MNVILKRTCLLLALFISTWASPQHYEWPNEPLKIVVLGSSTAAGAMLSDRSKSWVGLYTDYVKSFNPANEVINLAVGGYDTYHLMPTDFEAPRNRRKCDSTANITEALNLDCDGVIINLPSNDVYFHYSTKEQLDNFKHIAGVASDQGIPIWICTTQPRNFNRHDQRSQQHLLYDSIQTCFPENHLDFWTELGDDRHGIKSNLDSGDGTHLNYAGHEILADRVVESGAFKDQLVVSGEKILIEDIVDRSPYIIDLRFKGKLGIGDSLLAQGVKIEFLQRDSTLNTITCTNPDYTISSAPDVRFPFTLKFSGPKILTKTVLFDFSEIDPFDLTTEIATALEAGKEGEQENEEILLPIESLDMILIPLKDLGEVPADASIQVARFAYTRTDNFYILIPDQDFIRVQHELMHYYYDPIRKGKIKRFDSNGDLVSKFKYKNGKLHGKCRWYFPGGKQKRIQATFLNGKYHGKYTLYWENGDPKTRHEFRNGIAVGTAIEYDPKQKMGKGF